MADKVSRRQALLAWLAGLFGLAAAGPGPAATPAEPPAPSPAADRAGREAVFELRSGPGVHVATSVYDAEGNLVSTWVNPDHPGPFRYHL